MFCDRGQEDAILFVKCCYVCCQASHRSQRSNKDMDTAVPTTSGEEELQLQLALAMSKEEHEEEMKRQKADDLKLQLAIEESKKTARVGSTYSQVIPSLFITLILTSISKIS